MRIIFAVTKARGGIGEDDRILAREFARRGYEIDYAFWDENFFEVAMTGEPQTACLNRSTWDYYLAPAQYEEWLDQLEKRQVPFYNKPALMRAYMDKSYLMELAQSVPTIPVILENPADGAAQLMTLAARNQSDEIVIKPLCGAAGYQVRKIPVADKAALTETLSLYGQTGQAIIAQPFIKAVQRNGEFSYIYFNHEFSHGYIRKPATGDFRVQSRYGGKSHYQRAPDSAIERFAQDVLSTLPDRALYARIDGYIGDDRLYVSEIEVNEPYLSFGDHPPAAVQCVDAFEVMQRADSRPSRQEEVA